MGRFGSAAAIAALLGLLLAPTAGASFHLVKVREVYLGSASAPESKYVELQMYASGQQFVKGHSLRTYDASGGLIGTSTFAADVANGNNQSTILVATAAAEAEFGLSADAPLSSPKDLLPTGGAVCWEELDCVSWGSFDGPLPGPAGAPAAAVPTGAALGRTLARGCATALDSADDTNSGAADFGIVAPAPRPNAVAPTESRCGSSGGGGSEGPKGSEEHSHGAPRTILRRKPPKRTTDRTPSFRFGADAAKARFQCKLDGAAFKACRSPFTTKRLAFGAHVFKVRAADSDGRVDPSPASYRFRVVENQD